MPHADPRRCSTRPAARRFQSGDAAAAALAAVWSVREGAVSAMLSIDANHRAFDPGGRHPPDTSDRGSLSDAHVVAAVRALTPSHNAARVVEMTVIGTVADGAAAAVPTVVNTRATKETAKPSASRSRPGDARWAPVCSTSKARTSCPPEPARHVRDGCASSVSSIRPSDGRSEGPTPSRVSHAYPVGAGLAFFARTVRALGGTQDRWPR